MPDIAAVDHPVPGTGVTVRVERRAGRLDLGILGALDVVDDHVVDAVLAELVEHGATTDPGPVRLLSNHPPDRFYPLPLALADRLELGSVRNLFQMRRPLPISSDDPARATSPPLRLRPFDPASDADAWLRANNRAFASHPEQGLQSAESLAETLTEPWVDLEGFLVTDDADVPGELAGFCWTRVHPPTDEDPELGEIFVIGVDPRHHGEGLGPTLVLRGLDQLARVGVATGMLYVEADNQPALKLYDRLGFTIHHRHRIASR